MLVSSRCNGIAEKSLITVHQKFVDYQLDRQLLMQCRGEREVLKRWSGHHLESMIYHVAKA